MFNLIFQCLIAARLSNTKNWLLKTEATYHISLVTQCQITTFDTFIVTECSFGK